MKLNKKEAKSFAIKKREMENLCLYEPGNFNFWARRNIHIVCKLKYTLYFFAHKYQKIYSKLFKGDLICINGQIENDGSITIKEPPELLTNN